MGAERMAELLLPGEEWSGKDLMSEIEEPVVEAIWREASSIPESRIPIEMGRASREQPALLAFVLGSTESMGPGISELAGFIYFVIWRVFRSETRGKIKEVTPGAIQRKLERNEADLAQLDEAGPSSINEATVAQLTRQPALFSYMMDAIVSAEEDEREPVEMSPEEKGSLILLLKTAIDTLDDAREGKGA